MRKRVKIGTVLFEQDSVKVSQEINNALYFESNDEVLMEKFESFDVIESVAAMMKIEDAQDEIWVIKFKRQWNSSPEKALYWLTGGNREWTSNDEGHFKYSWSDVCHIFLHKYSDTIYDILENSETLGDIRDGFNEHLSLPRIYEFALNNGLVK